MKIQDECADGFHGACPNHVTECDCPCHREAPNWIVPRRLRPQDDDQDESPE